MTRPCDPALVLPAIKDMAARQLELAKALPTDRAVSAGFLVQALERVVYECEQYAKDAARQTKADAPGTAQVQHSGIAGTSDRGEWENEEGKG